jgi:anti-anti-sigma factor
MFAVGQCARAAILPVAGALRAPLSSELSQRVEAMLGFGRRRVLLDLSRLSALDAAGVGELVQASNRARAAGGVLEIANASRRIRRLLQTAGVLDLLTASIKE